MGRSDIGVPCCGAGERIRLVDVDKRLPDPLLFPGGVMPEEDGAHLAVIPMMLLRLGAGDEVRLLLLRLAEVASERGTAALEELVRGVGKRSPASFALAVSLDSGLLDLAMAGLADHGGESKHDAKLTVVLSYEDGDVRSPPIPARALFEELPRDDDFAILAKWPKKGCITRWCHSHWHWEFPYPQTRWTECHGFCIAPKDCRCGRGRGAKVCMGGWWSCTCR